MKVSKMVVGYNDKLFKDILALRCQVFGGEKETTVEDARDLTGIHTGFFINDIIVGCGSIYDKGDGEFEICNVAVKEHYRHFGMGTEIIELLKNEAKKEGAKVFVAKLPLEVLPFFEKNNMPKSGVPVTENGKKYIKCIENLVFSGAEWVQFGGEYHAVIVREDFEVSKKEPAELFVSGLGFCDIYINGKNISDRVHAPAWTNYKKFDTASMEYPIFDIMTTRILYEKIDVSKFLKKG